MPGGEFRIKFTPSEDAGSLRFSKRVRDGLGEDYERWSSTDLELYLERLGLDAGATLVACCAVLVVGALARWLYYRLRVGLSNRTGRLLVEEEAQAASAAAAVEVAAKREKATPALAFAQSGAGPLARHCRFCDVYVADEHMDAHMSGKKHRKMVELAGSLSTREIWVWRPRAEEAQGQALAECPPEPATDSAENNQLPALAKTGRVKGQTTKWEVKGKKRM